MILSCAVILSLMMEISANILYGGILNESEVINSTDRGLDSIVQMAFGHLQKYFPGTIPAGISGRFDVPTVTNARKTKLQYSSDNLTPLVYQEVTPTLAGDKFQRKRAILGVTFNLTLTWEDSPYRHNFAVTLDRGRSPYLYSHTFSRTYNTDSPDSIPSGSCSKEKECRTGHCSLSLGGGGSLCDEGDSAQKYSELPLSFVSYNIWNFQMVGPEEMYYARIQRLGKLISESRADVLTFQEVRFDFSKTVLRGPSQVDHLREHLPGYQFVFQPAMSFPRDFVGRIEEGLAVFSKHPIKNHDYILLSRNTTDEGDRHQRICLHAEIETPWENMNKVHVFVTHLSLSGAARERSVVEIWKYMQRFSGPALLMGDLNAEPNEKTMRFLRGEVEINGTKTEGLRDGWLMFHKEPRPDIVGNYQKDEPMDVGLTFSAADWELRKRIDYIFIREDPSINVQSVNVLDDKGRHSMASSDHVAVQATLGPAQ